MMSDQAFRRFFGPMFRICLTFLNFLKVEGKENIPTSQSKLLICANHRSVVDPFCIGSLMPHCPFFMAKDELFRVPLVGKLMSYWHAFPVKRGERDIASVQTAIGFLKDEKNLLVFPEGTRSKTGQLLPPKTGVALLAAKTDCDVLPVAVCFSGKYRIFKRITIRFGKVISNEELHLKEGKRSLAYANASQKIMNEIAALLPEELRIYKETVQ